MYHTRPRCGRERDRTMFMSLVAPRGVSRVGELTIVDTVRPGFHLVERVETPSGVSWIVLQGTNHGLPEAEWKFGNPANAPIFVEDALDTPALQPDDSYVFEGGDVVYVKAAA